jgi:hypothetical protein
MTQTSSGGKLNKELTDMEKRESRLLARKSELDELEKELRAREKDLKSKDAKRKQIILRLPESLWKEIAAWAEDDFRSINGQIEYILTRSVRDRRKQ